LVGNGIVELDDLDGDDSFRGSSEPSCVLLKSSLNSLLVQADQDYLDQSSAHYSSPFFRHAPRITRATRLQLPQYECLSIGISQQGSLNRSESRSSIPVPFPTERRHFADYFLWTRIRLLKIGFLLWVLLWNQLFLLMIARRLLP